MKWVTCLRHYTWWGREKKVKPVGRGVRRPGGWWVEAVAHLAWSKEAGWVEAITYLAWSKEAGWVEAVAYLAWSKKAVWVEAVTYLAWSKEAVWVETVAYLACHAVRHEGCTQVGVLACGKAGDDVHRLGAGGLGGGRVCVGGGAAACGGRLVDWCA